MFAPVVDWVLILGIRCEWDGWDSFLLLIE